MVFKELDEESKELLQKMCEGIYLNRESYALAVALHRGTGFPIMGLKEKASGVIRHAAVETPKGALIDARGYTVRHDLFARPFGNLSECNLVGVTEEDLFATGPIHDGSIITASKMAQAIWPELPWNGTTTRERIRTYLEEMEALSKKHRFWIRAPVPGCPPPLAEAHGNESYVAQLTSDGMTYVIDRKLD